MELLKEVSSLENGEQKYLYWPPIYSLGDSRAAIALILFVIKEKCNNGFSVLITKKVLRPGLGRTVQEVHRILIQFPVV